VRRADRTAVSALTIVAILSAKTGSPVPAYACDSMVRKCPV
jgi:hypothetical protein